MDPRTNPDGMERREALDILTAPAAGNGGCPVCGLPIGWLLTEAKTAHRRYHQAQAVLAAAVLGGAA